MFGKLDRYLARSFIEPFLVTAMVITGLYIVAEAFDSLPEYLRQANSILQALSRIGQIYALRIPYYLAPVVPVATLIGAAFGLSQLTAQNEINAMRASGLSYWRILSPIYAMAALAALLSMGNRELIVPRVEQITAANVQAWTGTEKQSHENELIVDEIEKEQTKFTLYYDTARRRVTKLWVLQTLPGGTTISFTAERAVPTLDGWLLYDAKGEGPAVRERIWRTSLKPRDLETALLPLDVRPLSILHHEITHQGSVRRPTDGQPAALLCRAADLPLHRPGPDRAWGSVRDRPREDPAQPNAGHRHLRGDLHHLLHRPAHLAGPGPARPPSAGGRRLAAHRPLRRGRPVSSGSDARLIHFNTETLRALRRTEKGFSGLDSSSSFSVRLRVLRVSVLNNPSGRRARRYASSRSNARTPSHSGTITATAPTATPSSTPGNAKRCRNSVSVLIRPT